MTALTDDTLPATPRAMRDEMTVFVVMALLLAAFRPVWTALPAVVPFAAASVFVLSPVFADVTAFFPGLRPLSRWLPATLYLQGGEGDWAALVRLAVLAAAFAAASAAAETLRDRLGRAG